MQEQKEIKLQPKVVDSREPDIIIDRLLEVGWTKSALVSGDYFFWSHDFKKIGIERKAVNDLLTSIGDRLSRQLEQCLDFYDKTILLIEGSWKTVSEEDNLVTGRGIERSTWRMVWNYLQVFQDKGVTVQLTINEGHTVKRVNELYALYQKSYHVSGKSKEFEDDRVLAFPSGCRGRTAMDCIIMFGSIEMICKASVDDLMHVNNVGLKKANLIWNHFHKGYDQEVKREYIQERAEGLQQPKLGL